MLPNFTTKPQRHTITVIDFTSPQSSADPG